ncbi:hypothetical protein Aduo_000533 [Ancylostoma duodenale]
MLQHFCAICVITDFYHSAAIWHDSIEVQTYRSKIGEFQCNVGIPGLQAAEKNTTVGQLAQIDKDNPRVVISLAAFNDDAIVIENIASVIVDEAPVPPWA